MPIDTARLRQAASSPTVELMPGPLLRQAADEIDRLNAQIDRVRTARDRFARELAAGCEHYGHRVVLGEFARAMEFARDELDAALDGTDGAAVDSVIVGPDGRLPYVVVEVGTGRITHVAADGTRTLLNRDRLNAVRSAWRTLITVLGPFLRDTQPPADTSSAGAAPGQPADEVRLAIRDTLAAEPSYSDPAMAASAVMDRVVGKLLTELEQMREFAANMQGGYQAASQSADFFRDRLVALLELPTRPADDELVGLMQDLIRATRMRAERAELTLAELREADARVRGLRARLANSNLEALSGRFVLTELDAALDGTDGGDAS